MCMFSFHDTESLTLIKVLPSPFIVLFLSYMIMSCGCGRFCNGSVLLNITLIFLFYVLQLPKILKLWSMITSHTKNQKM